MPNTIFPKAQYNYTRNSRILNRYNKWILVFVIENPCFGGIGQRAAQLVMSFECLGKRHFEHLYVEAGRSM